MLIEQNVKLELFEIKFVENPMNKRGKFVAYEFKMYWPLQSAFFNEKWPTHSEKDLTVVWGTSPQVTYFAKENRLSFKNEIENLIKEHLPEGFLMQHVTRYRLTISSYNTPRIDRNWCIYFYATRFDSDNPRMRHIIDGDSIAVTSDFMNRILALIPDKVARKFTQEQKQ